MKTLRVLILLLLTSALFGQGAGFNASFQFIASSVSSSSGLSQASKILYHQIAWTVTGSPASCTVAVDSSPDNSAWTAGGIIAGQTCTSTGNSVVTNANAAFIRINVTALSGGAVVTVNYTGWAYNPSGGGNGTVNANSGAIGAVAIYPATGGSTTVGPDATLVDTGTVLTYSGTNVVIPVGTAAQPDLQATGSATNTGDALTTTTHCFTTTGTFTSCLGAVVTVGLGKTIGWANATSAGNPQDTAFSRDAAGVIDAGNGTAGNTTAKLKASGYMSVGTKFTLSSNGCAATTLVGGSTAGSVNSGTTGTCAFTVTFGDTATAPNGWSCRANDITTVTDAVSQTASTTTTASFSGTTVSADVINFFCMGY